MLWLLSEGRHVPVLSGQLMSAFMRLASAGVLPAAGVLLVCLIGCSADSSMQTVFKSFAPPPTPTVQQPADVQYYPSDEPLHLALEHFNRGHYGIAERYFRDAVEKAPRDVTAWVGLAATYDRIARFDLADRAYASAIGLAGYTADILNNQGYSYMLRGNYKVARKKFLQAYALEPENPTIVNNLNLLDKSTKFIKRTPEFEPAPH
jgi:tetratricopeptide (TPR) repeat protein